MSDKDGHPIAQGSGFLISRDGRIVTNYHVIKTGSSAFVKLPNGALFAVDGVLASNKDRDVAIIKAHGNDFRTLTLGDSDRLEVGEEVVAIGNPLSLESTVSNGIVSAIRTEDKEGKFLQITAPISPGSSGGPLFNMAGKVVGITTSHIKGGENLNFAIPINDVKPMLLDRSPIAHALPDEAEPVEPTEQTSEAPSEVLANVLRWMINSSAHGIESSSKDWATYILSKTFSCRDFTIVAHGFYYEEATKIAVRYTLTFDLGNIDPGSIQDVNHGEIKFHVTDNGYHIKVKRERALSGQPFIDAGQILSKEEFAQGDGFLIVDDGNYRSRLTKAFTHAVSLCGGKPSTF
jgi:hypothetical protein